MKAIQLLQGIDETLTIRAHREALASRWSSVHLSATSIKKEDKLFSSIAPLTRTVKVLPVCIRNSAYLLKVDLIDGLPTRRKSKFHVHFVCFSAALEQRHNNVPPFYTQNMFRVVVTRALPAHEELVPKTRNPVVCEQSGDLFFRG